MSSTAIQPDLIISLSQDKVRLNLLANPETGRSSWKSSFDIEHLFLEEQIAQSLDQALLENPSLIDEFPCVEIIVLDRPNICLSRRYVDQGLLGEIASRHLRLRVGDTLTADSTDHDAVICYSVPTDTLLMLKEYYSNIGCSHLSSILWYSLSSKYSFPEQDITRLYFTIMADSLVMLAVKNKKIIFSKNFRIRNQADVSYYAIACSRMLKANQHWLVSIQDEEVKFEMPGDTILKIDQHVHLPSLHVLMSQYKVCEL